ncbi:MAG: MBL fold metallo-hydrolase [Bacillota bacterium]
MKAVLLGTSGCIAMDATTAHRAGPSVLVECGRHNEILLFDCGRSALQSVFEAGYSPANIGYVFFTHHHSDHNIGFPDLVLSSWVAFGKSHWRVYGPVGTRHFIDALFGRGGAFDADITRRAEAPDARKVLEKFTGRPMVRPSFDVHEIEKEGEVCCGEDWSVMASFAPRHVQPWLVSVAYRVESAAGSLVISGDTAPTQQMVELARGCSMLIHDCSIDQREGVFADVHMHTDPRSLGRIAAEAGVNTVVAYHFLRFVDNPETLSLFKQLVEEGFPGKVVIADDCLVLDVSSGEYYHSRVSSRVARGSCGPSRQSGGGPMIEKVLGNSG